MTQLVVGRCSLCGHPTGEVVEHGQALTRSHCENCQVRNPNPTRSDLARVRQGRSPTSGGDTEHRHNTEYRFNGYDQLICPNCEDSVWIRDARIEMREYRHVSYAGTVTGTVDRWGDFSWDDYEVDHEEDSWTDDSSVEDMDYSRDYAAECANCGHRVDLSEL